jgi:actin-related protein 3
MFQHFGNRLKRDLKHLVDRRLDASATASGSLQKVSFHFFPLILYIYNCPFSQSSGVEVDVISHKRQRFVLFFQRRVVLNLKS